MSKNDLVVVTGAGGFIGGHLVRILQQRGHTKIRAVDVKPLNEWYQKTPGVENQVGDLALLEPCRAAAKGARMIYNLAADMGGMGFIETHKAECMLSVLVSTHMLVAAKEAGTERFFYSSSACVYNGDKQTRADVTALKEEDAYPAMPEDGYGWEKLFSERMARHYREDYGIATRVARYHNVYGPEGTYDGGREKAPAAICRKVIAAKMSGKHEIEIWGDGEQTRSFMYIDDCTDGTIRLAQSEIVGGKSKIVQARPLPVDDPLQRCPDISLAREKLQWEPRVTLDQGLAKTIAYFDNLLKSNDQVSRVGR